MTGACDACGCALHECECVQVDVPQEEKPDPYPFIDETTRFLGWTVPG